MLIQIRFWPTRKLAATLWNFSSFSAFLDFGIVDEGLWTYAKFKNCMFISPVLLCVLKKLSFDCQNVLDLLRYLFVPVVKDKTKVFNLVKKFELSFYLLMAAQLCKLVLSLSCGYSHLLIFLGSLSSQAPLKRLLKTWTNRYPDAKMDPMNIWDDIITNR